jgi:hypothetical protein|tara:strand:- start:361 stop:561 length:201 start_codon:yes stop_codon:yes gene_type:complete
MQVSITFTTDSEDDGFDGSTTVVRGNIDDLYGLGQAFADAARAGGFTYVEDVGFEKDDGAMIFGGM